MVAWNVLSSALSRFAFVILVGLLALPARAQDKVVTITFTAAWTTDNPYGYSSAETNSIFCQTYGCLGIYDYKNKKPVGVLAESWEWINDTTMRFKLRRDLKRHDGGPGPTSKDIIHSLNITLNDKESLRRSFTRDIKEIREVDAYTFDMITKEPAVDLIIAVFDSFIITSAELYEKHGRAAYTKAPYGWGPYKIEEIAPDDRAVMRKNSLWPDHHAKSPDVVIYRLMREAEQRLIGLLNGEVQIAREIPPQLLPRLQNRKDIKIIRQPSIEQMFLLFNPAFKPWDDVRVRRAAALAIDRDLIIDRLLKGLAQPLQGWINEQQICFMGSPERPITYDPKKARQLLDEAGYKGTGPVVEFYTSNGRYTSDRQIAEVITQMLGKVGFQVKLLTPEWANLFSDIQNGKTPLYYMGRGTVLDVAGPMITYVHGATKRSSYRNPKLSSLLEEQGRTTDEKKRCEILRNANQIVLDDMPMLMMWSHEVVTGTRPNIDVYVAPNSEVWHADTRIN